MHDAAAMLPPAVAAREVRPAGTANPVSRLNNPDWKLLPMTSSTRTLASVIGSFALLLTVAHWQTSYASHSVGCRGARGLQGYLLR
jgi:hypothetical protein